MENPKSRPGSLEKVPQKPLPTKPRTARKLKTLRSDSDSVPSPNPVTKTPRDGRSKTVDRRAPRSLPTEKKRPNSVSELELQIAKLQHELKKAKGQLGSNESKTTRAQEEAEEAKKQLKTISAQLEDTQKKLNELTESEQSRFQELRDISDECDRAWQSELEAVQKLHSVDSLTFVSAMNEIQELENQLEKFSESEASQARCAEVASAEVQSLRAELTGTLLLAEKLKGRLNESNEFVSIAREPVNIAQMQFEIMKTAGETENANGMEAYKSLQLALEQLRDRERSLQKLVGNLHADLGNIETLSDNGECDETKILKTELKSLKNEADQLRHALADVERRYCDEYINGTLEIRNAYELVKRVKSESFKKEDELEGYLKESMDEAAKLREKLIERENALQNISSENKGLTLNVDEDQSAAYQIEAEVEIKLKKSKSALEELTAVLSEKETQLHISEQENGTLRSEIKKIEERQVNDEVLVLAEQAGAAEQEALIKIGHLREETDKNCRKAAEAIEQLGEAQASTSKMEAEMRRLKVQSDQWRKAAEAAAAMLYNGNINAIYVAPYVENKYDESCKKGNGNVLKKIGGLLKKGRN